VRAVRELCPLTSRIIHLPFASGSGHHTRYAPLPVRGSVHLSRQFLEKLTDSAIIKVALREDLSEVATGCGGLRLHPAVGEGRRRWRGTGSSNSFPSSGESRKLDDGALAYGLSTCRPAPQVSDAARRQAVPSAEYRRDRAEDGKAPIKCGAYKALRTQTANTKRPADSRRRAYAQIY